MRAESDRTQDRAHQGSGRDGRTRRRSTLTPWRLLALAVAAAPVTAGFVSCAEPTGITVLPTPEGNTTEDIPAGNPLAEICGDDGILCGDGCCTSGNTCTPQARCVPISTCETNDDCTADTFCGPPGQGCLAWSVLPVDQRRSTECRERVELPSVIPEKQCTWPQPGVAVTVAPESVQVIGTPMVIDFDFDQSPERHPSIVFVTYDEVAGQDAGVLRVIDGETCQLQASIDAEFPFTTDVSVAVGDVNNDGRPDIVAADEDRSGVAPISGVSAYEFIPGGTQFRLLSRRQLSTTSLVRGIALADLDNNEYPEILTEDAILTFDPTMNRLVELVGLRQHFSNGQESAPGLEPPVVLDIDGDRIAEMITSQGIFIWDVLAENVRAKPDRSGSFPVWNPSQSVPSTFVAMADLGNFSTALPGGQDSVEMVVVGSGGELWVKQIDGQVQHNVARSGFAGGPPVIADFDGDGRMEFASPGRNQLTVFDLDCKTGSENARTGCAGTPNRDAILWQSDTQGARSGAAVFDFDGDGRAEVVYADQCYMRVYDGRNGDVLFSVPRSSTTSYEYPVVADTDGDTFSELVTVSNDNDSSVVCSGTDLQNSNATVTFEKTHGVTVWREQNDRWAGSRPIWNQHAYFVTNVDDNGIVPRMSDAQNHWRGGPNTFRQNVQGDTGFSLSRPDLTTSGVPSFNCVGGRARVQVDVCNRGLEPIPAGQATAALIESGNPQNTLCRLAAEDALAPGGCVPLTCDVQVPPSAGRIDVMIMADPGSDISECNEGNNLSTISGVFCAATPT